MGRRARGERTAEPANDNLAETPPPDVAQAAAAAGVEPRLCVPADLGGDNRYGQRWLVAEPQRLLVIDAAGGVALTTLDLPLSDIRSLRVDSYVGTQALIASVGGDDLEIVRFSNTAARRYAKVRSCLQRWLDGQTDGPEAAPDPDLCPRCGQRRPKDSTICPHCRDRKRALGRLMGYLRPHLWKVVAVGLLVTLRSVLDLIQPKLNGLFFDKVLSSSHGALATRWLEWAFNARTPATWLVQLVMAMLVTQIIGVALGVFQGRLAAWLGYWVVHDIRAELYAHLQRLTLRYFDKRQTGAVMSRVTQDTRVMQGFLVDGTQNLVDNLLKLVAVLFILLVDNWRLTLLTVVPGPVVLAIATIFWRRLRQVYGRVWWRWEQLTAALQDSLSGVRVVKAFAGEEREVERFNRSSAALADAGTRANQLRATLFPWLMFGIQIGTLMVWYAGGKQVLAGQMTTGQVIEFLTYLWMFLGPMQWLSQLFNWFNETLSAAERVWEVLDERPDVAESITPEPLAEVAGRFEFDHVTFGYEPHEPVLKDICLTVEPGEMIGLVGHSGAGKSTLINLICRFYDVDEGRILIDGRDIRSVAGNDYRRHIGVVLQDSFLFNGTVYANIAYGRPEAEAAEVLAAAKAANAHDFIVGFADGYDTIVGERGHRLSGGERQRISIARAILHNPRVLILDEATASVDTETERQIQEALTRLVQGRTTFAIAHRLSTLRNADRLVVIEKGRIAEFGRHDELLAKPNGVFRRLVDMQTELNRIQYVGG